MKERPTLHALAVYLAILDHGTTRAAAEQEGISQPAITAQVKSLERFFPIPLLERSGRRVRPTVAGEVVAGYCRQMLALADDLERALADLAGLKSGHLVVGASSSYGETLLPGILARFHERYPGVPLAVRIRNTEEIVQGVIDRTFGFGIIGAEWPDSAWESWPICDDDLDLVVAREHPLLMRDTLTVRDLADVTFVLRESGSATRALALQALASYGVVPVRQVEFEGNEAVKRAVAAGRGVGILSEHSLMVDYPAGELSRLPCAKWQCATISCPSPRGSCALACGTRLSRSPWQGSCGDASMTARYCQYVVYPTLMLP